MQVVGRNTSGELPTVDACTNADEIIQYQRLVKMVPISEPVARYAVELIRATRPAETRAPEVIKKYVNYGSSVRSTQFLVLAAKARALSRGNYHVGYEDIRSLTLPVLRHRLLTNFHAESDGVSVDDILRRLLDAFPPPRD
jgi:MoxR-like ATPase